MPSLCLWEIVADSAYCVKGIIVLCFSLEFETEKALTQKVDVPC